MRQNGNPLLEVRDLTIRFGGVVASFAGNGRKGNGRGAEGSDVLATGDSRSDQ